MDSKERLQRYLEVVTELEGEIVSLSEFVLSVDTVSPQQIRNDLGELGFEPGEMWDTGALRSSLEQAAAAADEAPTFDRFVYEPKYLGGELGRPIGEERFEELHTGGGTSTADWRATELASEINLVDSTDELLSIAAMREGQRPYPHQVHTARRFIHDLGGRGIVADEVGLGKTIEAAMIISEYIERGLVKSWLLLVPASLVSHWGGREAEGGKPRELGELRTFYDLDFVVPRSEAEVLAASGVLLSIDRAKGQLSETLHSRQWDLVIVDECHILKNRWTKNYKLVYRLRKKYCLLISATPIQNEVRDLYNLVTLCKPGLLKDWKDFSSNYLIDRRKPVVTPRLRNLLGSTITRTRREETGMQSWKQRHIRQIEVALGSEERLCHKTVVEYVRYLYKHGEGSVILGRDPEQGVPTIELLLILILKELASSQESVIKTLLHFRERIASGLEVAEEASRRRQIRDELQRLDSVVSVVQNCRRQAKRDRLVKLIPTLREKGKTIIFTEFLETQEMLRRALEGVGETPVIFKGESRKKKDLARKDFKDNPERRFMISTESGGQGINLQFANVIVNYDFPWNPMRLEQRIGRVDRIKQEHSIWVYNLYARKTIEAYILTVLHSKLAMARKVVGEIGAILSFVGDDFDVEASICKIALQSKDFEEMAGRFEKLELAIKKGREEYLESRENTEALLAVEPVATGQVADKDALLAFLESFAKARGGSRQRRGRKVTLTFSGPIARQLRCSKRERIELEDAKSLQMWNDYPTIWRFMQHQLEGLPRCFRSAFRKKETAKAVREFFGRSVEGLTKAEPSISTETTEVLRVAVRVRFKGEGLREKLHSGLAIPGLKPRVEDRAEPLNEALLGPAKQSMLSPKTVRQALDRTLGELEEAIEQEFLRFQGELATQFARAMLQADKFYDALHRAKEGPQGPEDEDLALHVQLQRELADQQADVKERYTAKLVFDIVTLGLIQVQCARIHGEEWQLAKLPFSDRLFSTGCGGCGDAADHFALKDGLLFCDLCA